MAPQKYERFSTVQSDFEAAVTAQNDELKAVFIARDLAKKLDT